MNDEELANNLEYIQNGEYYRPFVPQEPIRVITEGMDVDPYTNIGLSVVTYHPDNIPELSELVMGPDINKEDHPQLYNQEEWRESVDIEPSLIDRVLDRSIKTKTVTGTRITHAKYERLQSPINYLSYTREGMEGLRELLSIHNELENRLHVLEEFYTGQRELEMDHRLATIELEPLYEKKIYKESTIQESSDRASVIEEELKEDLSPQEFLDLYRELKVLKYTIEYSQEHLNETEQSIDRKKERTVPEAQLDMIQYHLSNEPNTKAMEKVKAGVSHEMRNLARKLASNYQLRVIHMPDEAIAVKERGFKVGVLMYDLNSYRQGLCASSPEFKEFVKEDSGAIPEIHVAECIADNCRRTYRGNKNELVAIHFASKNDEAECIINAFVKSKEHMSKLFRYGNRDYEVYTKAEMMK